MAGLSSSDVERDKDVADKIGVDDVEVDDLDLDEGNPDTVEPHKDDQVIEIGPGEEDPAEQYISDERQAGDHDSDETGGGPGPAPSLVGVRSYRWRRQPAHLLGWWEQLPEATQSSLAGLRPGDPLDPAAATAVDVAGFSCAQVVMTDATGRRIRRRIASAALITQLQLLRMTHSERRLV